MGTDKQTSPGTTACPRAATVLTALLCVISGCAPKHPSPPAAPSASSAIASQPKPTDAPAACQTVTVPFEPKLSDQHVRCVLTIKNLTLDVSSDPAWSFALRDQGGVIQQFREPVSGSGQTGVAPLLQDIDDSGTPVLLVVLDQGGSGGEPMAVWRLTGSPPRFVRAGELFGFRQFYRTPEGLFGNYAHSSAASGTVTLYRWADDKLVAAAVLDTQAARAQPAPDEDGGTRSWVRNGEVLCALNEDDPADVRKQRDAVLRAAGIDPAMAQERLCTQPWVASIYR